MKNYWSYKAFVRMLLFSLSSLVFPCVRWNLSHHQKTTLLVNVEARLMFSSTTAGSSMLIDRNWLTKNRLKISINWFRLTVRGTGQVFEFTQMVCKHFPWIELVKKKTRTIHLQTQRESIVTVQFPPARC